LGQIPVWGIFSRSAGRIFPGQRVKKGLIYHNFPFSPLLRRKFPQPEALAPIAPPPKKWEKRAEKPLFRQIR